jgi:hypothetical protein
VHKITWNGRIAIIDTSIRHWAGPHTIVYGYSYMEKKLSLVSITGPTMTKVKRHICTYDVVCLASFLAQMPEVKVCSMVSCYPDQKSGWIIRNSSYGYTVDLGGQKSPNRLDESGIVIYRSLRPSDYVKPTYDPEHPHYIALARSVRLLGGVL